MSVVQKELKDSGSSSPSRPNSADGSSPTARFCNLRGVQWRINLGVLPSISSSIDDLRRVAADCRRRYADVRRHLLVDPYVAKNEFEEPNLVMDNPLSQNPDSMWGRFFRNAELEKMLDQDLSRLYPEHGSYFQTSACQAMLRRILLLWCLKYPETGYKQGMHELLAPLLYVLHVDVQHLCQVRKLHENHFNDRFDGMSFTESNMEQNEFSASGSHLFTNQALRNRDGDSLSGSLGKLSSLDELDPDVRTIIMASDAYGAEGELGILLSERFLEHDAYCMFDALMSGAGGVVTMADFFSTSPSIRSLTGLPPVIEMSSSLYSLLSIVDSSLHSHLVELGVEPQYFALRWLRVLFGREFLLENLLVVWDAIFESLNRPIDSSVDDDSGFKIASSDRGAFISGMAVSMMLQVRSSLLATENATSCLQRLLNFPENVDVQKLIDKARSLQVLALETRVLQSPSPVFHERSRSSTGRTQSLSSPLKLSGSPSVPISPVRESYWEEKWRISVLQKPDHQKGDASNRLSAENEGLGKPQTNLVRAESDPSPTNLRKDKRRPHGPVRRRLLDELAEEVGSNRNMEEINVQDNSVQASGIDSEVQKDSGEIEGDDAKRNFSCLDDDICQDRILTGEDSPVFSASTCSLGQNPDIENDSDKSSTDIPLSDETEDIRTSNTDELCVASTSQPFPGFVSTEESPRKIESDAGVQICGDVLNEKQAAFKERKPLSGKFQWFWRFGRNNADDSTNKSGIEPTRLTKDESSIPQDSSDSSSAEACANSYPSSSGTDGADKNLLATLRSLGQSMLENIQVIESAFQPERSQVGPLNLSRNILGGKGQVTAMTALKELRKISNLLSEM
ncbi:uncharacterized protein LOC116260404 [Nymphaea colorata]|nr:uncharacterized protein LOC116260404 [Nymphaea colorata]